MTIPDSTCTAGQFRCLASLRALLKRQAPEHLPPISWTITTTGTLQGNCGNSRPAYEMWVLALGKPDTERMTRDGGATRLTSTWDSRDGVQAVLTAIIDVPAGEVGSKS